MDFFGTTKLNHQNSSTMSTLRRCNDYTKPPIEHIFNKINQPTILNSNSTTRLFFEPIYSPIMSMAPPTPIDPKDGACYPPEFPCPSDPVVFLRFRGARRFIWCSTGFFRAARISGSSGGSKPSRSWGKKMDESIWHFYQPETNQEKTGICCLKIINSSENSGGFISQHEVS